MRFLKNILRVKYEYIELNMLLVPDVFYIPTVWCFILTEHGLASQNKVLSKKGAKHTRNLVERGV
jgi:hypothetical protein